MQFHAAAVAHRGRGCLILGRPGSGKSTLAIEMIALGAVLVGDDRIDVTGSEDGLLLSPPPALEGLIEARGTGLLRLDFDSGVRLAVIADLNGAVTGRLPPLENRDLLGQPVPVINGPCRPGLSATLMLLLGGAEMLNPDMPHGS